MESAADYLPKKLSLTSLRTAAAGCHGCDLYKYATQTVFGEGRARARLLLVGEQPGDSEDRAGRPFVGPAGRILHQGLEAAGIAPRDIYVTNAVKHFKFVERGKRRIHNKPKTIEIRACKPWLQAELEVVRPELIVALGATAAQSLLGSTFRLLINRGRVIAQPGLRAPVVPTIHPSAVLRAPDSETRHAEMRKFIADLRIAAKALATGLPPAA
ncbi:MAG: UdgX family uracil-DNA binding protein [Candidatus Eremiobacteraeota bacterium]|nr:UdgX family uracil-DNA binding protein [Candidatus Eremiobacteraeota bacterium]MBV9055241.1 UdgX family uracil-DNA binding protein [Candidatus Eremiobacteraeota bacterium]